jgi:benzodiazapine receptor
MNKIIIYTGPPVFYLVVAFAGMQFTSVGVSTWYPSLVKPSFTPPGSIIGMTWTIIYILSAVSLIHFISTSKGSPFFIYIIGLYIINGIVNAAWSYIFFSMHLLWLAVIDSALIGLTVLLIINSVWQYSKLSGILLLPYFLWVCFATYLSYAIYRLN